MKSGIVKRIEDILSDAEILLKNSKPRDICSFKPGDTQVNGSLCDDTSNNIKEYLNQAESILPDNNDIIELIGLVDNDEIKSCLSSINSIIDNQNTELSSILHDIEILDTHIKNFITNSVMMLIRLLIIKGYTKRYNYTQGTEYLEKFNNTFDLFNGDNLLTKKIKNIHKFIHNTINDFNNPGLSGVEYDRQVAKSLSITNYIKIVITRNYGKGVVLFDKPNNESTLLSNISTAFEQDINDSLKEQWEKHYYGNINMAIDQIFDRIISKKDDIITLAKYALPNIKKSSGYASLLSKTKNILDGYIDNVTTLDDILSAIDTKNRMSEINREIDKIICIKKTNDDSQESAVIQNNDLKDFGNYDYDIATLKYWKIFSKVLNKVALIPSNYSYGMIAQSGKIPLPVKWTPIYATKLNNKITVIFITSCGIVICPTIYSITINENMPSQIEKSFRGGTQIKNKTYSKYISDNIKNVDGIIVDTNPHDTIISSTFLVDDLPIPERINENNLLFVEYLNKWCKASKFVVGL